MKDKKSESKSGRSIFYGTSLATTKDDPFCNQSDEADHRPVEPYISTASFRQSKDLWSTTSVSSVRENVLCPSARCCSVLGACFRKAIND